MSAVTEPVSKAIRARQGGDAWSLYLDKLCFHPGEGQSAKGDALDCVCDVYRRRAPMLQPAVDRAAAFRQRLADHYGPENVRVVHLRNSSRLLLHLARANPLENVGLYAERITGLPIIPGPAVKGVLSTWACWCQNIQPDGGFPEPRAFVKERRQFTRDEAHLAECVLGDNDPKGSKDAGEVVFLGAWPATVPTLERDITTPHPEGGNPIPNPFLAIARGTVWAFVFIARPRRDPDAKPLLETAERWLREALDQMGLGAKTAAGYGRFRDLTDAQKCELRKHEEQVAQKAAETEAARIAKAREEAEMAGLQPDPAMLQKLAALKSDGDLFGKVNVYKTEEGGAINFRWPGTRAEQLAMLEFCVRTAWSRVSGNRNCRKALANLAKKFNRELPA